MKPRLALAALGLLATPLALTQCTQSAEMRGRIEGLEKIVDQAERNGAMRCAPRELAIARSQLEFASIELDQGFVSKAQAHLAKAEPNAHAAEMLSPAQKCAHLPDEDGDGYADPFDKCPTKPENYNGYQDEDGCPDDPDTDRDGIADSVDQCELNPEDKDAYLDTDGCPEPDNDLDGLLDAADKCPNEPKTWTATKTKTAARIRTTTRTPFRTSRINARTRSARRPKSRSAAPAIVSRSSPIVK
ncbi:MAG TPA: thrombospondin type 3 repeat-containing protein [Polyangiaceae bacterium]|nr:thrombospondin type 3 repeat-containing protein [Polyangiaceae bacterium]